MTQKSPTGTVLNVKAAAKRLGLSKPHLDRLRITGGGPKFVKLGRRVVYRVADLDDWLEANLRSSTSETDRSTERW
jgi:excisionase family DNA binding protein